VSRAAPEAWRGNSARRSVVTTSTSGGTAAAMAAANRAPSFAKTSPGVSSRIACLSIAKSRDALE
jgi:hypothetical protein